MQQIFLGLGAVATKTFVDDVFSTFLYTGDNTPKSINNGIDLAGEGGLVWIKKRAGGHPVDHFLTSSVSNGSASYLKSNANNGIATSSALSSFNSNGFNVSGSYINNDASYDYTSWTFRKAKGFFDVVTYTGNGNTPQAIAHNLGSMPGMVIVKKTSGSGDWMVWHRDLGASSRLELNAPNASGSGVWGSTEPTSTHFYVAGSAATGANGATYVAYVFAGGESTAATARSVDFDGSGDYLLTSSSSDYTFGTGDFTVEHWIKPNDFATAQVIDARMNGASSSTNWCTYITTDKTYRFFASGSDKITSNIKLSQGVWSHIAIVRNGGTTTLYVNGISQGTYSDSNNYNNTQITIGIHGPNRSSYALQGELSNVRVIKGTAVYTSSFRPPYEPLTNITNTKLLCCNNSSVTGATTGTVTSGGNPTASTDSPFDDPSGFKFGDSGDQNVIKCGSYVGNSTANHEIYVGFEPQWWLVKNVTDNQNWQLLDSMRGWVNDGNDKYLVPNNSSADGSFNFGNPTPTGFNLSNASSNWQNESGKQYVYIAIRRSDGYVGKPPELGTGVFAMDTGNNSSTIPAFDSGFPVDFALTRKPASVFDWYAASRLTGAESLKTNTTDAESTATVFPWDSNTGWAKQQDTDRNSWMWKRHAGFDVVTYKGTGSSQNLSHGLGKSVEMGWIKCRSHNGTNWSVWHKDIPDKYILINSANQAQSAGATRSVSSTQYEAFNWNDEGASGRTYIAMLFASVSGISAVGSYNGSSSAQTITTGFQPRFLIIKQINLGNSWFVLDTTRGWGSGNDQGIVLDSSSAQFSFDFGTPTSTGFTLVGGQTSFNDVNNQYIYYAHA